MDADFWAITSYFNPGRSKRRLANFRAFRRLLGARLAVVEWSPGAAYELREGDADLLVQVGGGDLMWQKERLLNLGIARLPADCRYVAWLDCDIVFDRPDWVEQARRRLEHAALVQLFSRVEYLEPCPLEAIATTDDWRDRSPMFARSGAASMVREAESDRIARPVATEDLETFSRMPSPGFAWAARRDFLAAHPLFDAWVVGGGDSAYFHAAARLHEQVVENHGLAPAHREHYLSRSERLSAVVDGRIGHVAGTIRHLWHGEFANRRYRSRHSILSGHAFDPQRFLRATPQGVWAWGDVPPGLPAQVSEYFAGRREDAVAAIAA